VLVRSNEPTVHELVLYYVRHRSSVIAGVTVDSLEVKEMNCNKVRNIRTVLEEFKIEEEVIQILIGK